MLTYILFVIGFGLLIKGADFLVEGASAIAKKYHVPSIVIGLTIVSFGTSAPEFVVSMLASYQGNTEIAIGNILGSNIANILLILGVSAIIFPLATKLNTVWKEIPMSLLAALVLAILANDILIDNETIGAISRADGMILIGFFIIFLYYTFGISKVQGEGSEDPRIATLGVGKSVLYIAGGLAGLVFGGKWIVDGAVSIAQSFNVSESLIGLTIVAIGTSLPELATSAIAAYKKHTDIAIGNVIGSNIFNIFWVLGFSALVRPLPFSATSNLDVLVTIGASALLFLVMFIGKRHTIQRWQGAVMIAMYVGYLGYLIAMA